MTNHPNRNRTENTRWMSVSTPTVFREIKIRDINEPTDIEERKISGLEKLADKHGTHVETTTYPRG